MAPIADFCWEGRLTLDLVFLGLVYLFVGFRLRALQGVKYPVFSPRGLSGICIYLVTALLTAYSIVFIANYNRWRPVRELWGTSMKQQDDALIAVIRSSYPADRKQVSFALRMLLVTTLWLVKASFIAVFYQFSELLPKPKRVYLYFVSGVTVASFVCCWIITGIKMSECLDREGYSPTAGAAFYEFLPLVTWSRFTGPLEETLSMSLLSAEVVISVMNALTDLMLLSLMYLIARTLQIASGRGNWRALSLLAGLSSLSIAIALARLGVLVAMTKSLNLRLAFDTMTDIEAYVAACASCIPAVRVLVREGNLSRSATMGFADSWAARIKIFSTTTTTTSGTRGGAVEEHVGWRNPDWDAAWPGPGPGPGTGDAHELVLPASGRRFARTPPSFDELPLAVHDR